MRIPAPSIRQIILALAAFLSVNLASGMALADTASSWIMAERSGQVRMVKPGISPIALTTGDVFSGGDWIETGPDGRAVLRRGEETIVVAPNSRIGLPRDNTGPFATRILQTLGTILLTVEKRAKQHFEVQTPYLTAVVKGTTFTVGIQGERTAVHVVEGLVEVKDLASGRSSLVRPGQTGSIVNNGAAGVEIQGGPGAETTPDTAADTATPAAQQASAAASASASASAAGRASASAPASVVKNARQNAAKVTIRETLGGKPLDLSKSTKGLVRAADRAAPQANLGRGALAKVKPTQMSALGGGNGRGLAVGLGLSANPGLGKSKSEAKSNGLASIQDAIAEIQLESETLKIKDKDKVKYNNNNRDKDKYKPNKKDK